MAWTFTTKALLLEGTNISYKNPSLRRHNCFLQILLEGTNYILQKPFPWKATLFIISSQLKEHCQKGNLFKYMIRGTSLTSPYTQLDILFLPLVAPIFPLQFWSYHGKLSLYCWSHSTRILSTHWCYTARATNHQR